LPLLSSPWAFTKNLLGSFSAAKLRLQAALRGQVQVSKPTGCTAQQQLEVMWARQPMLGVKLELWDLEHLESEMQVGLILKAALQLNLEQQMRLHRAVQPEPTLELGLTSVLGLEVLLPEGHLHMGRLPMQAFCLLVLPKMANRGASWSTPFACNQMRLQAVVSRVRLLLVCRVCSLLRYSPWAVHRCHLTRYSVLHALVLVLMTDASNSDYALSHPSLAVSLTLPKQAPAYDHRCAIMPAGPYLQSHEALEAPCCLIRLPAQRQRSSCACGVSTTDCASGLQTQGVSASGIRVYPANLLLHDRQAQQQASAPQSTHHYHHDLPDSVKYQPKITDLSGPQVDDMHSLPDFAGNSMGGGVMQKVSPQAISQTANFSRFNHSALPSSRKPSAPMHTRTCKPQRCL